MYAITERERTYDGIIGQDQVTKLLKTYSKDFSFPDVMFFIGHSGGGKGTLALITAMTLNCQNPIKEKEGTHSPCMACPSCEDILSERFQMDTKFYDGGKLKADGIEEISDSLECSPMWGKNKVYILDEAQMITSLSKFLVMIEKPRKGTYFIILSTDKNKFKNIRNAKTNKEQEASALRSRGAFFSIQPVGTTEIMKYLAKKLDKIDPDQKIPDIFITEALPTIAENANGNVRQALNDFYQCVKGEAYTKEDVSTLLNYADEKDYFDKLVMLAHKESKVIKYIQDESDLESFFNYTWTILSNTLLARYTNSFKEQWQIERAKQIMSGDFDNLIKMYQDTYSGLNGYFNNNVFITNLFKYMNKNKLVMDDIPVKVKTKLKG
jgi:DNA polymerase-3 subunit gamma/tau